MYAATTLLFVVNMNWIDSYSRVDDGVIDGSCRINSLLFVDDLVPLAHSEQGLQCELDWVSAVCHL